MSVIIKAEEMPKRCADCTCCFTDESNSESFCSVYGDDIPDIFNGRLGGCPLVEVPTPHGDLIDRGELLNGCQMLDLETGYDVQKVEDMVEECSTIIEAEG